jgi:diacylglycerol kinase family enzyme
MNKRIENVSILTNLDAGNKKISLKNYESIIKKHCSEDEISVVHRILQKMDEKALLEEIKRADLLVLDGGDGTVQKIVTFIIKNIEPSDFPLIGVLPSGSTNLIALDVGIVKAKKNCFEKFIKKLKVSLLNYKIEQRATVHIRSNNNLIDEHGFFIGFAQFFNSSKLYNNKLRKKGFSGKIGIFLTVLYNFYILFIKSRFKKIFNEIYLKTDEKEIRVAPLMFYVSSLVKVFFINHNMLENEKKSEPNVYVFILKQCAKRIIRTFVSLLKDKEGKFYNKNEGYAFLKVDRCEISKIDGVAIDGEIYNLNSDTDKLFIKKGEIINFVVFE